MTKRGRCDLRTRSVTQPPARPATDKLPAIGISQPISSSGFYSPLLGREPVLRTGIGRGSYGRVEWLRSAGTRDPRPGQANP